MALFNAKTEAGKEGMYCLDGPCVRINPHDPLNAPIFEQDHLPFAIFHESGQIFQHPLLPVGLERAHVAEWQTRTTQNRMGKLVEVRLLS